MAALMQRSAVVFFAVNLGVASVFGMEIALTLPTDEVIAQAPVSVVLKVRLDAKEAEKYRTIVVDDKSISMSILDPGGVVHPAQLREYVELDAERNHTWIAHLSGSDTVSNHLVLNKWCSTGLAPGDYTAEISLERVWAVGRDEADTGYVVVEGGHDFALPLTVVCDDAGAAGEAYAALFAEVEAAKTPEGSRPTKREDLQHLVDLLVYSREPAAIPYQLKIFCGELRPLRSPGVNHGQLLELALYFSKQPTPEAARRLVDWFDGEKRIDELKEETLTEIVLWTIVEMHKHGVEEIQEITGDIAAEHPNPKDPFPPPWLLD